MRLLGTVKRLERRFGTAGPCRVCKGRGWSQCQIVGYDPAAAGDPMDSGEVFHSTPACPGCGLVCGRKWILLPREDAAALVGGLP